MVESTFRRALLKEAEDAFSYVLGNGALACTRFEEAVTLFGRALRRTPDSAKVHFALAQAYRELGQEPTAAEFERKGQALDPRGRQTALYDLGQTLEIQGKRATAAEFYRLATNAQPPHAQSCFRLGRIMQLENQLDQARAYFQQTIESGEAPPETWFHHGKVLCDLYRFPEALASLERGAIEMPYSAREYPLLVVLQLMLGRYAKALDSENKALALSKQISAQFLVQKGYTLLVLGRYTEVAESLQAISPSDSLYPSSLTIQGMAMENLGELDAAAEAYRQAIAADPAGEAGIGAACQAMLDTLCGRPDQAMVRLQPVIAASSHPWFYTSLGYALDVLGDVEAAAAAHRQAIEIPMQHIYHHPHWLWFHADFRAWARPGFARSYEALGLARPPQD